MVADVDNVEMEKALKTFQEIGLSESKAKETLKNHVVTENLLVAVKEVIQM